MIGMKIIKVLLFSLGVNFIYAQDSTVTYLDNNWKATTLEDATCYRIIKKKQADLWLVEDYWMNGIPQFKGSYKTEKLKNPVGEFIVYDHQGTITAVYNYDDDSKLDGTYLLLNSDGQKDAEREYAHGKKNGYWKWYYDNGLISWFEQWRNDTLVMLQQFSKSGEEYKDLFNVSIAPRWKDKTDLSSYLQSRLSMKPPTLKTDLLIYVSMKGKVEKVESQSKLESGMIEEINKILMEGPDWLPGLNRLRPIDGILEYEFIIAK